MQNRRKETGAAGNPCVVRFVVVTFVVSVLAESIHGALGSYPTGNTTSGAGAIHPVLEPPAKLSVVQGRNKKIFVTWSTPEHENYTGFRFKVVPVTDTAEGAQDFTVEHGKDNYELRGLSPGASYQVFAFTRLYDAESSIHATCNFTVRPRSPTNLIFWFRNETTLLMIWQPPFPTGYYTHYKVSLNPRDARESELYVKKEGGTPAPAQAAFLGLIPGRSYTVSVQTVSESEVSAPLTGQQRTVPTRPRNLTIESNKLREKSFEISWWPPEGQCEFEKYQISVSIAESGDLDSSGGRRLASKLLSREQPTTAVFEDLQPGAHYTVTIKTLSGKVSSWPATIDVTLKPLAVRELQWREGGAHDTVLVEWQPADASTQDEYKVFYSVTGHQRHKNVSLNTIDTQVKLTDILPECNYTVSVIAISSGEESEESVLSVKRSQSGTACALQAKY